MVYSNLNLNAMWTRQIFVVVVLVSIGITGGHPDDLKNYAPAHEYKSSSDYSFSYGVKDLHTGDIKHQWEKKDGDTVRGHYSVLEPDGSVRTVDYTADGKSGFNAIVKHTAPSQHPSFHRETSVSHHEVIVQPKPNNVDYTTLKEYQYGQDENYNGNNEVPEVKQTYIFVPQTENHQYTQESINTKIEIPPPNFIKNTNKPIYYHQPQHQVKPTPQLPVDLSLIKQTTEKLIPVDVSLLNPVEIDLSPREPTQEDINKFLSEYFKSGLSKLNRPVLETGFKPIIKTNSPPAPSPSPPTPSQDRYKSNKKPVTTPGLSNFASKGKTSVRGARLEQFILVPPPKKQQTRFYRTTVMRNKNNRA